LAPNRESGPGAKDSGYQHDAANRMEQGRQLQYGYDDNGNQTVKIVPGAAEKSWVQSWDDENRLTSMEKVKGTEKRTVTFAYDPQGRRISKELTTVIDGVTKTSRWSYIYDNDNIALEIYTDDSGAITSTYYTHGAGVDEHLALERSGGFHYYHADGLGSIVAITDTAKNVVQRYEYDSFGMVTPQTDFVNSYTYTGREWDKEIGLYFYRARYYDPMEGRFVSKDPIGFKGNDMVLYGYVQNSPTNFVDPYGLLSATGGAGLGGGFHLYFIGLNAHSHIECGSGGCYTITSICGRLGPGMFLGGGTEIGGSIGPDSDSKDVCEESCEESWGVGAGADFAYFNEGAGGGVSGGPSGVSVSGGVKSPLSLGIGISLGVDVCYNKKCPLK